MVKYYFASTALPALIWGEPPEITFSELMTLFRENLSEADLEKVAVMRRVVDLYNLCAFWREEHLDPHGNLTRPQMEEAMQSGEGLPAFVCDYLEEFEGEERLRNFGKLFARFFQEEHEGFLGWYMEFEREWRLVMTGFRAKALGRDPIVELQWEDPDDALVAQIIAQKDAPQFEPPEGYEELKEVFAIETPMERDVALEKFRFQRVDERLEKEIFSIGFLLGYTAQLMILERRARFQ